MSIALSLVIVVGVTILVVLVEAWYATEHIDQVKLDITNEELRMERKV